MAVLCWGQGLGILAGVELNVEDYVCRLEGGQGQGVQSERFHPPKLKLEETWGVLCLVNASKDSGVTVNAGVIRDTYA